MTTTIHRSPSRPALRLPDLSPHSRRREFAILQHFFFFSSFLPSFSFYFSFLLLFLSFFSRYTRFSISLFSIVSIRLSIDPLNDRGNFHNFYGQILNLRCKKMVRFIAARERVALSKGWTNQLLYPTPRKTLEAEAPNVHERKSVIAYFEREKEKKVVKSLQPTTNSNTTGPDLLDTGFLATSIFAFYDFLFISLQSLVCYSKILFLLYINVFFLVFSLSNSRYI